jgi:hypothetical protein
VLAASPGRGFRRRLIALGLVIGAVPLAIPPAVAQERADYAHFALHARATGTQVLYAVPGLLPVDPLVEASSLFAEAILERSRSTSLAAAPSPGPTVLSVPGLVDGFTGGGTDLPEYPLAVRAEHPLAPEGAAAVGPLVLDARADDDGADSRARASSALGGDVSAIASTRADADGRLQVRAESAVSNINILEGLITIGAVRSVVVVRFDAGNAEVVENRTAVGDVRIAGIEVSVGDGGLVVADQPIDLGPVLGLLGQQGDATGLQIRVLAPTENRTETGVVATTGSLVVELPGDLLGQASTSRLVLGEALASASARERAAGAAPGATNPALGSVRPAPAGASLFSTPPVAVAPPTIARVPATPLVPAVVPASSPADPIDFRSVYVWLVALGISALLLQRWTLAQARGRRQVSDLRPLWRW